MKINGLLPEISDLGFLREKNPFPGLKESVLKKIDRLVELPSSELNFKLFGGVAKDIQSEFGESDITCFDFIFDTKHQVSEKKLKILSGYSESFVEVILLFLISFYELKILENDDFVNNELKDYIDYINSIFYIVEKKKTNIVKSCGLLLRESRVYYVFDSFVFFKEEEKILSFFTNLIKSINNYQYFLSYFKTELPKIEAKNIDSLDELNIGDLDSFLVELNNFYEVIQKTDNDFKTYLYEVLKVLNLFISIQRYIKSTSYDFVCNKILNSKEKGKYSFNLGRELEEREEMLDLSSLLILMTHLYKKCSELDFDHFEKDFLKKFTGIDISAKLISKFKKSELKAKIEDVPGYNNRLTILKIVLKGEKIFLNNPKENDDNKLFEYIKGLTNNEKLTSIYNFFSKNIVEYSKEELIFIFTNDFDTTFFVEERTSIVKIMLWIENGIDISDIKNLNNSDFIYLRGFSNIGEVKELISSISENTETCNQHASFVNKKENFNQVFNYIHKSYKLYGEIEKLLSLEFSKIQNIPKYIEELNIIFSKNTIDEISNKNEELLSGENIALEDLDLYYILFEEVESKYLDNLLEKIFSLNVGDFQYIKKVLPKFEGDETSYKRLSKGGYIKKILINKDLIDLYVSDYNDYNLLYILDRIDEEQSRLPELDNFSDTIENEIKEVYQNLNGATIIDLGFEDDLLKYIISIGRLLNGYKGIFVGWIEENTKLTKGNFENIFNLFSFFKKYEIYVFDNIGLILDKTILLKDGGEEIAFLYKSFKGVGEIKDTKELLGIFIKYLKEKDEGVIEAYILKLNKIEVLSDKREDKYVKNITEDGSDKEKEKLGEELSVFVSKIVELFNVKLFTSTLSNDSGKGTGGATRTLRNFYLRNLLIQKQESFVEYLNRIYIINWKSIIETENPDFFKVKRFANASYSSEDIDYLFFEAFEKFLVLISNYESLQSNNSFSKLISAFNVLYEELVTDFKTLNKIR